jgi:hypothetical protein
MSLSELELETPESSSALNAANLVSTPLTRDWADDIWRDLVRQFELDPEGFDSDCLHEATDGSVPVYYHQKWKLFSELAAWSHDEDCAAEYGRTATDLDAIADQLLDWCALQVANHYFSEIKDQISDWEDEDDDA